VFCVHLLQITNANRKANLHIISLKLKTRQETAADQMTHNWYISRFEYNKRI